VPDGTTEAAPPRAGAAARGLPARAAARIRRTPLPLAVLLVVALAQGLAWSVMTVPFNGPDEPGHIAYTQLLAETGHGPKSNSGRGSVSTEVARAQYELNIAPNVGHTSGRPTWSALPEVSRALERVPASQRKDGTGPNAIAQNPPLYYAYEALAYRLSPNQSLLGRLFAMRVATVALYVLTVGLMWLVAGEIFARPWVRFLATAVVALQPKLAALSGNVNPDTLLVTISTGFVFAGLRLLRRGPTPGRVAAVAVLAGLGALTHGRGLFLLASAVLAIAVALVRARPRRGVALRQVAVGAAGLLACLATAYLWTRSSSGGGAFGGEVGRAAEQSFSVSQFLSYLWQFYLPKLGFMEPMLGPPYGYRQVFIETFFGGFANFEVGFRPAVYDRLQELAFVGFLALVLIAVLRHRVVRSRWPEVLFVASVVVALLGLLHISSYRDLQVGGDPLITGRYLLPAIAAFGLAVAWVIGSLPRRVAPWAGAVVLAGFVLLDVEGFLINAQRFYG
jgi:4-amino-4-deoxy-L-arabinose transferase-like glycosyltransferase